jgi:hypothetical protein
MRAIETLVLLLGLAACSDAGAGSGPTGRSAAPGAPRPLEALLHSAALPGEGGHGAEWRTLQRIMNDPRGDWFPVLEYGWIVLDGRRVLAGHLVSGAGTGYEQTSWVLLDASDTLAAHPLWKVRASEIWDPGGTGPFHAPFRFRGCLSLLPGSALLYVGHGTAETPPVVLGDSLTPPAGIYRLREGRMLRVAGPPAGAAAACALPEPPEPD